LDQEGAVAGDDAASGRDGREENGHSEERCAEMNDTSVCAACSAPLQFLAAVAKIGPWKQKACPMLQMRGFCVIGTQCHDSIPFVLNVLENPGTYVIMLIWEGKFKFCLY